MVLVLVVLVLLHPYSVSTLIERLSIYNQSSLCLYQRYKYS